MCVYVWQALTSDSDTPCTVYVQWAATSNGIFINAQCRCVNRSSPMVRVVCFCLCMMMWTRAFDGRGHACQCKGTEYETLFETLRHKLYYRVPACRQLLHALSQVDEVVMFGMLFSSNTELGPSRLRGP